MPKDWKDIPDDEILNYDDAHTGQMARYGRIMQKRSTDAMKGLTDTIYKSSQGLKDKTEELLELYRRISISQGRQQKVVIGLTVVLALSAIAYTLITWQSVGAMRESNEIQRQLLEFQKSNSIPSRLRGNDE